VIARILLAIFMVPHYFRGRLFTVSIVLNAFGPAAAKRGRFFPHQ